MKVCIITPVYEDLESAKILLDNIYSEYAKDCQIIVIDDGSQINPLKINDFEGSGLKIELVSLKRNVGHQEAICVGLNHFYENFKDYDVAVVMDSDGEDDPVNIISLVDEISNTNNDVVVASRKKRNESWSFKFFYKIYKLFFSLLTGRNISFGNFFCIRREALGKFLEYPEISIHIAGALIRSKLSIGYKLIDRSKRYAGKSKMNFQSLVLHGFKAFMVFAEDSLVRVGTFCALLVLLIFVLGFAIFVLKFIGLSSPGWFSISLGILTLVLIQTGTLTLMMLMLTGVVKSNEKKKDYKQFIKEISNV